MSQNELAQTMMQQGQSYANPTNGNPDLNPGGTPRQAWPPPAVPAPESAFRMVGDDMAPLFEALSAAQGAFKPIGKDETASVTNREGKFLYNFSYADLAAVIAATSAALSANGLCFFDAVSGPRNKQTLRSILAHKSGCYIESKTEVQPKPDREGGVTIQAIGSEITYLRRYARLAMLGVFPSNEDDDGSAAEGNKMERQPPQQRSQQNTQRTPPTTQQRPAPRQEARPQEKPAEKVAQPAPKAAPPKEATKSVDLSAEAGKARLEQFAAALKESAEVPHDPETGEVTEVTEEMVDHDRVEENARIVELTPEESLARRKAGIMQAGQLMQKLEIRQQAAGKAKLYEITGKSDQSTLTLEDIDYLLAKLSAEVAEKGL